MGCSSSPSSARTDLTARIWPSASGLEASTTCRSRSAWRASSSVALNDATRACGRSRMKPTVSESSAWPPPRNRQRRVRVSSVANSLFSTSTPGVGQRVHQRALAGVGVADQRDRRHVAAAGDLALLPRLDLGQLRLELLDPVPDQPAVFLELLFARAAHPDAALVPRQVGPHPLEPGHRVFELRQLDLEVGLVRSRVRREDVEDHLGAIDHLDPELLLEVARLGGAQVVVEDDDVGLLGLDERLELLDLARADVGRDVDLLPLLQQAADHLQAGRLGQSPELLQGIVRRRLVAVQGQDHPDQNGSFSDAPDARCDWFQSRRDLTSFPLRMGGTGIDPDASRHGSNSKGRRIRRQRRILTSALVMYAGATGCCSDSTQPGIGGFRVAARPAPRRVISMFRKSLADKHFPRLNPSAGRIRPQPRATSRPSASTRAIGPGEISARSPGPAGEPPRRRRWPPPGPGRAPSRGSPATASTAGRSSVGERLGRDPVRSDRAIEGERSDPGPHQDFHQPAAARGPRRRRARSSGCRSPSRNRSPAPVGPFVAESPRSGRSGPGAAPDRRPSPPAPGRRPAGRRSSRPNNPAAPGRPRPPSGPPPPPPRPRDGTPRILLTYSIRPSASSVSLRAPSRTTVRYDLGKAWISSTSRVADPTQTTRTPEASGSSVPAWPTFARPTSRTTRSTTAREVIPRGLSTTRMPPTDPAFPVARRHAILPPPAARRSA